MMHRRPKSLGTVVRCFDNPWDGLCVDIFRRPDGTFGFQHYRRDHETVEGWFPLDEQAQTRCQTEADAVNLARSTVVWLDDHFGEG